MHGFRRVIERDCSICGKALTIKLRRPRFGWKFWHWKIISGGIFWWVIDDAEYWECQVCYDNVDP